MCGHKKTNKCNQKEKQMTTYQCVVMFHQIIERVSERELIILYYLYRALMILTLMNQGRL